jgi:DNA polymerase III delta prime subunit
MIELRPDQREVVKKLVNALSSAPWVALQAPTGWGKTIVALEVIKELKAFPALWLTPRLAISLHVYANAINMGLRTLATAGKEKLCGFGYTTLDFARGVCRGCPLNKPVRLGDLKQLSGSLDFGRVKEYAESMGICPYSLQSMLERYHDFNLVIAHYGRAGKLVRAVKPRLVVVDEVHNTLLPAVHRIEVRTLTLILQKLGFEEGEINQLVQSPESLRAVLAEVLDTIILIAGDDDVLKPAVEELVSMLQAPIWYYDGESINALELPLSGLNMNVPAVYMSATLPPQLLSGDNVIIVKRGWSVQVKMDTKYVLSLENISRRKNEISKYIDRYLQPGTVVFTTISKEDVLSINNDVVWEDEVGDDPCKYKDRIVALRTFGRFNEGVDLNCFSRLIVLGLPLFPPHVMNRLRSRGIDERSFAAIKTTQIIGRLIRSIEKPSTLPEIILIDRRFRLLQDILPNYEIEVINA